MMKNTLKFLLLLSLCCASLLASKVVDDEETERTFTQANPWYSELVQAAKEQNYGSFWFWSSNLPFSPEKGMQFAASRSVQGDASEPQKQQALRWFNDGRKAGAPMEKAFLELLKGPKTFEEKIARLNLLCHLDLSQEESTHVVTGLLDWADIPDMRLPLFKFMKVIDLSPVAKARVFNTFRRIIDDVQAHDEAHLETVLSLMDALYALAPEATCDYEKGFVDRELSCEELGWKVPRLLMHLKLHDAEAFETRVSQLLSTRALEVAWLMVPNSESTVFTEGSSLDMDHLLDIGCNPQHPQSAEVFERFLNGNATVLEAHKVKIAKHLNAYLADKKASVASVVGLLDDRTTDLLVNANVNLNTYILEENGCVDLLDDRSTDLLVNAAVEALVTYFVNGCTQPQQLAPYYLKRFLERSSKFSDFYHVHNTLFQAFNRTSFHKGVQLLWINQVQARRKNILAAQILTYFGCSNIDDLGNIPDEEQKDILSRALYDALVSPSKAHKEKARGFIRDSEATKMMDYLAPTVIQLGGVDVLADPEVSLKGKLQTFNALVDAKKFTRGDRARLAQTLDPVLTDVMDCTLTALDETLPSVQRCSAMNRLLDLEVANPDVMIPYEITKRVQNAFDSPEDKKSREYRLLKDSSIGNIYLNSQRETLYAFKGRPGYFCSSDRGTYDHITAFDADTGRALWMTKMGVSIDRGEPLKRRFLCEAGDTLCAIGGGQIAFFQKGTDAPLTKLPLPEGEEPFSLTPWGDDKFVLISGKDIDHFPHARLASVFASTGAKLGDHALKGEGLKTTTQGPWVLQHDSPTGEIFLYDLRTTPVAPLLLKTFCDQIADPQASAMFQDRLYYIRSQQERSLELVSFDMSTKKELWSQRLDKNIFSKLFFSHKGSRIYVNDSYNLWVYSTVDDDHSTRLMQKINLYSVKGPSSFLSLDSFRGSPTDENILYGIISSDGEVNVINVSTGKKSFCFEANHGSTKVLFGINAQGIPIIYS